MSGSTRDVKMVLSVESLGQENITKLQKALQDLAATGGEGSAEFAELADEVSRLGEQGAAIQTIQRLTTETDALRIEQERAGAAMQAAARDLDDLRQATAQAEATQAAARAGVTSGQQAYVDLGNQLRTLKVEYDATGKQTEEYRARLRALVTQQNEARSAMVGLRSTQQAATAAVTQADAAQRKAEGTYKALATQYTATGAALQKQSTALQGATAAATALGVNTASLAQAEAQLVATYARGTAAVDQHKRAVENMSFAQRAAAKGAALLKDTIGQITAGNLVADGIRSLVERVKDMGREFLRANVQIETLRRSFDAIYTSTETTARQIAFLRKTAADAGVSVGSVSDSFVRFSAAMKFSNVPLAESNALFAATAQAAGTLGLSGERTTLMLDALAQMASKGVVSMEELRQQLGDSLPGALSLTAKGLGLTDAELIKLVESGNLATRDFIPAFTRALGGLRSETEGLVPTWNRFTGLLATAAQNAGDAGWVTVLSGALKIFGGLLQTVVLGLTVMSEALFTTGKAAIVFVEALRGNGREALQWFNEETARSVDRLTEQAVALQTMTGLRDKDTASTVQAAGASAKAQIATEGLTRSQQAASIAANLNGQASLDLGTKYTQLTVAIESLLAAQQKETENKGKLAKAAKEEGETLIALATLRGEERDILETTAAAASKHAAALDAVAQSQAEETRLLEAQRAQLVATSKARGDGVEQINKQAEAIDKKLATSRAEEEQAKASAAAAKQEADARGLAVQTYADNSKAVAQYKADVDSLTETLQTYEKLQAEGKVTDEAVLAVRKSLTAATVLYRDSLDDLVRSKRLEAETARVDLETTRSTAAAQSELSEAKAASARASGDLALAIQYETEAKKKKIEADRLGLQIKELEIKLEREELAIRLAKAQDDTERKEIELRIKLTDLKLKEIEATRQLINIRESDLTQTRAISGALQQETSGRGAATSATDRQGDALDRLAMKYTLSSKYSERQIALLEREAAAQERLAELERKRLGVDKEGFSTDKSGNRIAMGGDLTTLTGISSFLKSAGLDEANAKRVALEFSDGKGDIPYFSNPGQMKYGGANSTISQALLKAAERVTFAGPAIGSQAAVGSTSESSGGASGGKPSNVTVNIGGRSRTIGVSSQGDASTLVSVLRELESNSNSAA